MTFTATTIPAVFEVADHQAAFLEHIRQHDTYNGGRPSEACAHCAAATLLPVLFDAWRNGTPAQRAVLWSMQDGYGTAGYTPDQGYDWSGIRDSQPATVYLMAEALKCVAQ